jgi:hypothetical protein
VQVSCAERGTPFSGDLALAESAAVSFHAFLAFFHAAVDKKAGAQGARAGRFEAELDGLDLYLAQCGVYERPREGNTASSQPPLEFIWPHIDTCVRRPALLVLRHARPWLT